MGFVRFTFFLSLLLLFSNVSKSKTGGDPTWTINCQVWDNESKGYVSTGQEIVRKYQIGYAPLLKIGIVYGQNNSSSPRELKIIDVMNGYDPNVEQQWWFNAAGGLSADPGEQDWLEVSFVGATNKNGWIDEGTYESEITFEDQTDGAIYKVPITIYAFKPGK
ncbi:MAG: hypothetical protein KDC73_06405 [Ignavibacteriae bacterium]|nr:hypothetical protein [Ignavibacteriota bacterium]MCB9243639.1 hypothetical protein [Ignavibacteriales bacterium]